MTTSSDDPVDDSVTKNSVEFFTLPDETTSGVAIIEPADDPQKYILRILNFANATSSDYYWNLHELRVGDLCVIESKGGQNYGTVSLARRIASGGCGCSKKEVGRVVRPATDDDMARSTGMKQKEKDALGYCRRRIVEYGVEMSLSRVHYTFDGAKAIFYFTAEGRVDFRDLVRDLTGFTRVKVEMRQVGVRDEAKMIGGCGPCGGQLCCSGFMGNFSPVSIRMAKDQGLSLNPSKISGVCGRLMCCLGFEHAHYKEKQSRSPKLGKSATVKADGRVGKVIQLNLLKEEALLLFESGVKTLYNIAEVLRGAQKLDPSEMTAPPADAKEPEAESVPAPRRRPAPPARRRSAPSDARQQPAEKKPVGDEADRPRKKRRRPRRSGGRGRPQEDRQAATTRQGGEERAGEPTTKKKSSNPKGRRPKTGSGQKGAGGGSSTGSERSRRQRSGTRRPQREAESGQTDGGNKRENRDGGNESRSSNRSEARGQTRRRSGMRRRTEPGSEGGSPPPSS